MIKKKDIMLKQSLHGLTFKNPIGIAAGLDKNATFVNVLFQFKVGFVEVGSVTLYPNKGHVNKYIMPIPHKQAFLNSIGLENKGSHLMQKQLKLIKENNIYQNIGVNLAGDEKEITTMYEFIAPYASYITINISCPNVSNDYQNPETITQIMKGIKTFPKDIIKETPILFKLSPDLSDENFDELCKTAFDEGAHGLVLTNSSNKLREQISKKTYGGASGVPLFNTSIRLVERAYKIAKTYPHRPFIVGCSGIKSGKDAYQMIKKGASLIQIYTTILFSGLNQCNNIHNELLNLIKIDNHSSITDVIGIDVHY